MKRLLIIFLLAWPLMGSSQAVPYNRPQIAQWLQDGAWDDVIAIAQSAVHPDSFLLQAASYASYQAGDKAAAGDYYKRLLLADSNSRQALYYSALLLKAEEHYKEAIPLLERLCVVAPATAQYHVLLADSYTAQDMREAALKQLQAARGLSPSSAIIGNKLANAWIRLRAWDSASGVLNGAMRLHPGDAPLISTAITLAYARRQFSRASAMTDSLLATGRPRYESLLTGIYADMELKNYPHAIQLGEVLSALGSETEEVLYYTALAHQGLGHWRAADTLLRKCITKSLKPNLDAYYTGLGEVAAKQQQWARSKACYDTAYYLFRKPLTLYRKGLMLERAGKKSEAVQVYKKYLSLPVAVQDTAVTHYLQGVVQ